MHSKPGFQLFPCLVNAIKITRKQGIKYIPQPFSVEMRFLREENLILLANLKESLKPNREKVLKIMKEIIILFIILNHKNKKLCTTERHIGPRDKSTK